MFRDFLRIFEWLYSLKCDIKTHINSFNNWHLLSPEEIGKLFQLCGLFLLEICRYCGLNLDGAKTVTVSAECSYYF